MMELINDDQSDFHLDEQIGNNLTEFIFLTISKMNHGQIDAEPLQDLFKQSLHCRLSRTTNEKDGHDIPVMLCCCFHVARMLQIPLQSGPGLAAACRSQDSQHIR